MVYIIVLAMVAAFVALRLYTVLGRRTGHEQQALPPRPVESERPIAPTPRAVTPEPAATPAEQVIGSDARDGVRAIVAAEPSFDVTRFLDGAKAAYRMTLEAFWAGDEATIATLADESVRAAFGEVIAQRATDGHVVGNRLVGIDRATIEGARLEGRTAYVTVRFDADVAAVTRDADGTVVAGSMTDAVPTHDLWTFSRTVRSDDPNWLLVETDDVE